LHALACSFSPAVKVVFGDIQNIFGDGKINSYSLNLLLKAAAITDVPTKVADQ